MRIDVATLRDLEIFESGGTPLVAILDHTRTPAGRSALREHLRTPIGDEARLRATQGCIRELAPHARETLTAIGQLEVERVERYLALSWEPSAGGPWIARVISGAWMQFRYRTALEEMQAGLHALEDFFRQLRALCRRWSEAESPMLLGLVMDIEKCLADDRWGGLTLEGRIPSSPWGILSFDRLARVVAPDIIHRLIVLVGELDALASLAYASQKHGWRFPELLAGGQVTVACKELRHPLLPAGVANDVVLGGAERVILVTGPNMAGKSTLLRAVALAVYLAHLGCGVPAAESHITIVQALLASLAVRDSLAARESYFLAEVRRAKALAALLLSEEQVFAVIDEPFKGTNLHDGGDATARLVASIARHPHALTIISTHLADTASSFSGNGAIRALCLEGTIEGGAPVFDYQLRAGVSAQRLGMELLRTEGVLTLLDAIGMPDGREVFRM